MPIPRRKFLQHSIAASAAGMLSPLSVATAMEPSQFQIIIDQKAKREKLFSLLGDLPTQHSPKAPVLLRKEQHDGYTLEYLEFDFNGIERVPGILLVPEKIKPKAPCMLYCHAHFGTYNIGKDELLNGRSVMPPYASVYAQKGIVTLAIDSWCFGERKENTEMDTFKRMLWQGQTLFGMMLYDEMKALDYLLSRPEVDTTRVGVFGLSMGATKAWWLSALDTRITTCIDLCCMTDFDELIKAHNLKGHGIYYYVPSLLKHFETKTINELIVPRPHVSLNGRFDDLTPPKGVEKVRDYLLPLYAKAGKPEDCRIELFDCPHEELPEMRKIVLEWLDKYLIKV
ncbi:MAG TPA: alpha/beta hydrolase family protein [Chryseolinea sp.]|nr:alpha/beta hydrolase family protein [Chryseolinea sp.]